MTSARRFTHLRALLALVLLLGALSPLPVPIALAKSEPPRAHPALLQLAAEHPNETFMVIVQRVMKNKNLRDDDAEKEVRRGGGTVKRQFPMIESFSAELTGREIMKLARHPKVSWISFDAPVVPAAAGDPTVRDDFNWASYSNNNGTQSWAGDWTESGDDGSPGNGSVRISAGALQLKNGNRSLTRPINLADAVSAVLSFQYLRSSFEDAGDFVAVQASADGGGTWTELARLAGPANDNYWQTASFDIVNYKAANTQIRLVTSWGLSQWDLLYVDNVQIEYVGASQFVAAVRASQVWGSLQGQGVTVAVVDSGISDHADFQSGGASRIVAWTNETDEANPSDGYGHGTHVAGIIGGSGSLSGGLYSGVAPQVNLLNVKVSNAQGVATTSDLLDGLQWILANKDAYNIRVVNISLNSTVAEPYHTSALDAAVEILWFSGITVIVAAGNNGTGSGPVTLYPPANDPFVITVGAAEDKGTPALGDDTLAAFSAYGTTSDGFAKPDLVAPGRHVISTLASTSASAYVNHVANRVDANYFRMSGTSMAAPVVAGAAALLLQDEPNLTPDQVKFRLMATANPNWPGYAVDRAGAGYLDVEAAVNGTTTETANTGLTVSLMLFTGSDPLAWGSVNWNSVNWNSVNWNSVNWNSVNWNSVNWNSDHWGP